jgi:hypothetical protein
MVGSFNAFTVPYRRRPACRSSNQYYADSGELLRRS